MAAVTAIPWREWWIPFRPWRIVAVVEAADEIPPRLPARGAVIVGSPEKLKWIAFDCPCRSGHRIMITLDSRNRPHWEIASQMPLTLWPSVDYHDKNRRCHYIIRDGAVEWVRERYGGHGGPRR